MAARVWIVDDSPLQRELCARLLSPHYAVEVFAGGAPLLEKLAPAAPPDVLVVDWQMPDMTGIDLCRFIRTTLDGAQLPILVVTTNTSPERLLEALEAGANDFLGRPLVEAELIARIRTLAHVAKLHARLEEAEQRLRVEAEFRERFMGMLAHDLRQPLNAILLASQMLSASENGAERFQSYLAVQRRAGGRMRRMISDLLDFTRSRPEHGLPIQRKAADLEVVARACLDELRLAGTEHRVELKVRGECSGTWDPDRLAQICSNLFSNALEHAPADTPIQIQLEASPSDVVLRVTNQGPALDEHKLETLFLPFRRGELASRKSGGVGLGLHIVQQIVLSHRGKIEAHSENGLTHFEVTLPRAVDAEANPMQQLAD